ncbi:MAG: Light-sensor Protein kinase [Thelocarpon impressellum]|nr:MAG: Light-sensor Protein kinase [Thelocarpon impressellum]
MRNTTSPPRVPRMAKRAPSSSPSGSDSPVPRLSSEATDRVFPIRSVVSVDPMPTPSARHNGSEFPGMAPSDKFSPPVGRSDPRSSSVASASSTEQARPTGNTPIIHQMPSRRSTPEKQSPVASSSDAFGTVDETTAPDAAVGTPGSNEGSEGSRCLEQEPLAAANGTFKPALRGAKTSSSGTSEATERGPAHEGGPDDGAGGVVTARFRHVATAEGHAVVTGLEGKPIQRCEDEPIHIPGAVQGFGLLVALREESEGKFAVRIVSENSHRIIGFSPSDLFALESFCDILSEEQAENLLDHIDFIRDEDADPKSNGPEVFTIFIRPKSRRTLKLWCAMHVNRSNPDLIICEFELEDDQLHPLVPAGDATPEPAEDTLSSEPTPEEVEESTTNTSRPLRVLKSARRQKGEAAAMEVFNIMSQVQEQLAAAPNLQVFLKVLVGVIKELTGFHRVMIYQFDQSWNGQVVTELVDYRATKDLYKGLHFPASDIPQQARDLYKVNKVRLLYDRDQETARLVCRSTEDLQTPLDLTFSYLRAMSPIHLKYLANMAVRASMSISINAFDELWGLIACHSYGAKGMRVSFPLRKMCRLIGDSASRNVERLSLASRLQARKLINTMPTEQNPSGYIISSSDDLLQLFRADFGLLSIRDETKVLGRLEDSQEALAMLEYLRLRRVSSVMTSKDIQQDFPDLRYGPGFRVIAGLLLVPLTSAGEDFIVFFRRGHTEEVRWAGNPYENSAKEGTDSFLEPRKSFRTWSENVVGKCRDWSEEEVETAAVLCLVYGKFINVWRQKEAALQNTQLTRLLLANSAHEVRTPLNAIINYLEIALEGEIDPETRENLAKSHSASKSLIYVINDLLDLTKTEEGHDLVKDEIFDLPATIREATDMFRGDARRKQIGYDVVEHPGLPQLVVGDQRRVQQAVANVTANAIANTSAGAVTVELRLAESHDGRVDVDFVIEDTGTGMSPEKLDHLFRDLEQVQTEGEGIFAAPPRDGKSQISQAEQGQGKRTLGLGLALVARVVRNMDGQLRLKSEEGKGSRFVIQLPFDLPPNQIKLEDNPASKHPVPLGPMTPPPTEGEVMLVTNSHSHRPPSKRSSVARKSSIESMNSMNSLGSFDSQRSNRSDVDRLIDAISEPHMATRPQAADRSAVASSGSGWHERRPSGYSGRPTASRAASYSGPSVAPVPEHLRSLMQIKPGQERVADSRAPLRAVRMPDGMTSPSVEKAEPMASKISFDVQDTSTDQTDASRESQSGECLSVLVAEDDPINSKIIKKRLEKMGHKVHLTGNGEECASTYGERAGHFDVVLMDMQMPIVDGLGSTRRIRALERAHPPQRLSPRAAPHGRIPVFAVSASLMEQNRESYISAGFDGWILKPIDFQRINTLLAGIVEKSTREAARYRPGNWEQGGWFRGVD